MKRLLFLSGSSRVGSANWRLVGAAAALVRRVFKGRAEVEEIDLAALDLPTYSPGREAGAEVAVFVAKVANSNGLFLSSDEYTGTYSVNLRNAAGWLSAAETSPLAGKPVALCGVAAGGVGGLRGHPALYQFLAELGADVRAQRLQLGTRSSPFGPDGALWPRIEAQLLEGPLAGLVE